MIAIDLATPTLALIKMKARVHHLVLIDYLTLIRRDEGWRMVAKTYQRLPGD